MSTWSGTKPRQVHIYETLRAIFGESATCRGCPFVNIGTQLATESEAIRCAVVAAFRRFAPYYQRIVEDLAASGALKQDIGTDQLVADLQDIFWTESADLALAEFGDGQLKTIATALQGWTIKPAATEGYRTAEVTLGGVDTTELSSKTMESKKHPGLYFIGEVVDVTGHLGGFNFQWAWSSGYAAGQAV